MIHVLTLTWNGLEKLERLHSGLIENLEYTKQPYRWYIRDNGSKDKTIEIVKSWPNTVILEAGHNRDNFACGVNSLSTLAKTYHDFNIESDMFLLINNDVEFVNDSSLSQMLALIDKDVSVVGSRLLYNNTNTLQHAGVIFGERYGNMPYHYRHQEISDINAEKNRYFQAVTAAVCLITAKDFDAIGGLDEKFHWAFEDIDMCLRIGALGKKIVYCGESKIFHEESASLKKNPINKLFMSHNVNHFKQKWFGKYSLDHTFYLKNSDYNEIKK